MSAEEKEEFKIRAKQTKKWHDPSPVVIKPADIVERERKQIKYEETMKTVIEETIGMANLLGSK